MKILLIGAFASAGRPLLERFLQTPCNILSFPGRLDEDLVLAEIEDADVVVGAPFTKQMSEKAKKLRLIQNTGIGIDRYDLSNFPPGVRLCVACQDQRDREEQKFAGYNRRGSKDSQLK